MLVIRENLFFKVKPKNHPGKVLLPGLDRPDVHDAQRGHGERELAVLGPEVREHEGVGGDGGGADALEAGAEELHQRQLRMRKGFTQPVSIFSEIVSVHLQT